MHQFATALLFRNDVRKEVLMTKYLVMTLMLVLSTLPVGTAIRDVSIFGCRDMTGNGREWTRTIARQETRTRSVDFSAFDLK